MKKLVALFCLIIAAVGARPLHAATFNGGGVTFPDVSADRRATPFPSTATVSGLATAGPISSIRVTLNNLTHARPDDVEILLVSPWGAKLVILADAGGAGTPASGINLTFDDVAAILVPDAGPMTSGSFKPTCVDNANNIQSEFPGVAGPYETAAPRGSATLTSVFGGSHNPNGVWSLYVVDDNSSVDASTLGSWTLDLTVNPVSVGTTTTLGSTPNPSTTAQSVTFTATVRKQSDNTPVTSGTVTFREGPTTLAANVPVNVANGQASFSTTGLTEGDHPIIADYNASGSFLASTANVTQRVNNVTIRTGNTFCNPGALTFKTSGVGTPNVFPSRVTVSSLTGTVSKVTLTISNLTIDRPDDFQALLVAPNGANFNVAGNAGGTAAGVNNITLTFDDGAASLLSDTAAPITGTYRPTSYGATSFPAPAPAAGSYNYPAPNGSATFANIFTGLNPNGAWSLYLLDDVTGGGGFVANGWCLTFTTSGDAPTTTTLASAPNPSLLSNSVSFTATVRRSSDSSVVTSGTVTFREGNTILAGARPLNASGQASFSTNSLSEGSHLITAEYNGVAGQFNVSLGTVTQRVDRTTLVASNVFCNPGPITVAQTGSLIANVYPSRILVSNAGASVSHVSVTVSNLTIERPDDLELLLVSPSGSNYVLVSDAGGTAPAVNNITLTFSDAAANFIPNAGPLTGGTFKPTSVNSSTVSFPAPAPAAPYIHPGPFGSATLSNAFVGSNPNGYWSLYVRNDADGPNPTLISGGWCLGLETRPSIACPANIVTTNAPGQCQSAPVSFSAMAAGFPAPTVVCRVGASVITSPAAFPPGVTAVTCTASNSAGTNSCTFTVTVNDAQKPLITCPANIVTTNTPGLCSRVVNFTLSPTDNCPGVTAVAVPPSGTAFPVGTNTVNVTATDASGNTATCSFTITVNDTQSPAITCPGTITVTATGQCPAVVTFAATATDNCSIASLVANPPSGSTFPVGTNTVNVIARDAAGNSTSCSFKVAVLPGLAPKLTIARASTNVVLSWPNSFTCYALQSTPRLWPSPNSNVWTFVAEPAVNTGGRFVVTNAAFPSNRFYRLFY